MASYRDLSDYKSQEAYEKLMGLFEKKKVGFRGKTFVASIAGQALADFVFVNGRASQV